MEIDRRRIITSDEALALKEVPKSIVVLGAGAVGVEFASIYRSYGSDVTIVELLPRLVPIEDEAVSAELQRAFKKRGIKAHTGAKVTRAVSAADGVDLDVQLPDGKVENLKADYLLVATGRGPVTDGLGAVEAGLPIDRGYIVVDEFYRTGVAGISARRRRHLVRQAGPSAACARGDCRGDCRRGAHRRPTAAHLELRPGAGCTFCDPEVGSIGLTEQKAKERGFDVVVGLFPFMALGRAKIAGETDGFVKIVADKKYDEVLGVHIIGPRATDLIAEASRRTAPRVHGRGAD